MKNKKMICLDKIGEASRNLGVSILAYSIAINHFHLKFYLDKGGKMGKFKNILHSGISREYRRQYKCGFSEFWQPDKTYFIKDNKMSWKVAGYIIGNLLKHKEVSTFTELFENQFSSYKYTVGKFGEEEAKDIVYRVIDIKESADGDVDLVSLKKDN